MDDREWQEFFSRLDSIATGFISRMGKKMSLVMENDVTPAQYLLLRTLSINGPYRVGELAERMGTSMSAITNAVDRMHRQGWVRRERDEKDRRQVWIHLTRAGTEKIEEVRARRAEIVRRYAEALTKEERETIMILFERLAQIDDKLLKSEGTGDPA